MATSSSRKKSNLKRVDRISELPDHLLCRILAFLPTRYAVATSVLSLRWEYVWTGVPVLNFTNDPNRIITDLLSSPDEQYQSRKRFMNRVLLYNSAPCFDRVDFAILLAVTELDRKEWFKVLSRRSVKELNLFYSQSEALRIMLYLDGTLAEDLVALRLQCFHHTLEVAFSSRVHLPRLEKIHLEHLRLTDDNQPLRSLILASPRLWELNIVGHSGEINFCCLTLKILKLSTLAAISGVISVPNLEYLELFNEDWGSCCTDDYYRLKLTDDMQHLVEAKVDCCMKLAAWGDLFQTLRHVIKLNVSIKLIAETCDLRETATMHLKLPYFNRLKCLEVHCIDDHCILQTRMLLKHMPNCVSLIIHMLSPWSSEAEELKGWPEVDSLGLGLQVEYIEIDGFGRNRRASAELLKNLLVCCTGLKEAKLHLYAWGLSFKQKNVMWRTMMNLSWPSGCRVFMDNRDVDKLEGWPEVDSLGLGLHVEYIEIDDFGRNKLVSIELLKYLLICCTRLKEVKLHLHEPRLSGKRKNVMRKTVMRLSPFGCKIIIIDPPSELT